MSDRVFPGGNLGRSEIFPTDSHVKAICRRASGEKCKPLPPSMGRNDHFLRLETRPCPTFLHTPHPRCFRPYVHRLSSSFVPPFLLPFTEPAIGCYLFRIEPMNAGSTRYTDSVPRRYIHAAGDGLSRSCNIRLLRYLPHFQAFRSPSQPSLPPLSSFFTIRCILLSSNSENTFRGHGGKSVPDERVSRASSLRLFIFMRVERFHSELLNRAVLASCFRGDGASQGTPEILGTRFLHGLRNINGMLFFLGLGVLERDFVVLCGFGIGFWFCVL